jgi:hypothetical protein
MVASVQARVIGCETEDETINHANGPARWSPQTPVIGASFDKNAKKRACIGPYLVGRRRFNQRNPGWQ